MSRRRFVLFAGLAAAALPARAQAPVFASQEEHDALHAPWRGYWTNDRGYLYEARLNLTVNDHARIDGAIRWTLRRSPLPSEQANIGLKSVEYIRGEYRSGRLLFEGYDKGDTDTIIGKDEYALVLAKDLQVIEGVTRNHVKSDDRSKWTGKFRLIR